MNDFKNYRPEPSGTAFATDGTRIGYYINGETTKEHPYPLFIFNGFSCFQTNLKYLIKGLSSKMQVISWDYKGHGKSEKVAHFRDVNIYSFVEDAVKVLQEAKIDKVNMLGYSMGAQVSIEFAKTYPDKVHKIISLNGTFGGVFNYFLNTDLLARLFPLLHNASPFIPNILQTIWTSSLRSPISLRYEVGKLLFIDGKLCKQDDLKDFLDQLADLDANMLIHLADSMQKHSVMHYLDQIPNNVLLMAGTNDQFAPLKCSVEAASNLKNGILVEIKDGTHNSNLEQPEFIIKNVLNFLS